MGPIFSMTQKRVFWNITETIPKRCELWKTCLLQNQNLGLSHLMTSEYQNRIEVTIKVWVNTLYKKAPM